MRYLEKGMRPFEAALKGAREVGSMVFAISVSRIRGNPVRRYRAVSMLMSLTATSMMCADLIKEESVHGWMLR